MKRSILGAILMAGILICGGQELLAQSVDNNAEYDKYVSLLRKDLRSGKKQLVAANMTLTDTEATKFWPIYDKFTAEQTKLYDERVAVIKDYAANFNTLTNATAASLNQRSIAVDQGLTALRVKYLPLVAKVLPGKKSALFFQLDKRIGLLIDLQLAVGIPLVEQ